jgi:hypothetical protein
MRRWFGVLFTVGLLAGCQVTIGPSIPFPNAIEVVATDESGSSDPVVSSQLSGGSSVIYRVDLAAAQDADVVYFELNQPLRLTVYNSTGTAVASSNSADSFAEGTAGLSSALTPSSISVTLFCRGSCVILNTDASFVYVEIENSGASSVNYGLYAFGDSYTDTNEPANNSPAGAVSVTTEAEGAIETLGDIDYFSAAANGTLRLTTATDVLDIRATVSGPGLEPITIRPGQIAAVQPGDLIRVFVEGNDRAAVSGISRYTLTIE